MSEFTKGMSFIFQSVCPLSKIHLEPYKMRNLLAVKIYFYFVANWGRQRGLLSRAVSDDCLDIHCENGNVLHTCVERKVEVNTREVTSWFCIILR